MTSNYAKHQSDIDAISRRSFMQLAIAGALAMPADMQLLSAARASEPKKGGRFRLGVSGSNTGDSLDPARLGTGMQMNVSLFGAVYNNLMEIAPDGKLIGELARENGRQNVLDACIK